MKNFAPKRGRLTDSSLENDPRPGYTLRGLCAFASMAFAGCNPLLVTTASRTTAASYRHRSWVEAGLEVAMASSDASAPKGGAKYKTLISQFINYEISASEFQSCYLKAFKNEEEMIGGEEFDILEYLFTSADGYVADPESRRNLLVEHPEWRKAGQGLDDEELRACARNAYRQLYGE
jgi:Bacterial self-protective colicin-like immunity